MTISLASLQKLNSLGLTTEQMAGVIDVLAVELAPLEAMRADIELRRSKDRARKFHGKSKEHSTEIPAKEIPPTPPKENNSLTGVITPPMVPPSEPDGFEAFWTAYPKRDGNADRKGALKAFPGAVKRAGCVDAVTRAAGRYAAHCREKGKIGTEFVKQARSWLNGDLWREWLPQESNRPAMVRRVPVFEDSEAWRAWRATGKRFPSMDLRDETGTLLGRGWWFPTEFPEQREAAA